MTNKKEVLEKQLDDACRKLEAMMAQVDEMNLKQLSLQLAVEAEEPYALIKEYVALQKELVRLTEDNKRFIAEDNKSMAMLTGERLSICRGAVGDHRIRIDKLLKKLGFKDDEEVAKCYMPKEQIKALQRQLVSFSEEYQSLLTQCESMQAELDEAGD